MKQPNRPRRVRVGIHEQPLVMEFNRVKIVARERGKIIAVREGKNIVVNQGRSWLRGLLGAALYPSETPAAGIYLGEPPDGGTPPLHGGWDIVTGLGLPCPGAILNNYRMRFVALGSGGIYSAVSGAFTESVQVASVETPLPIDVAETRWLKQILPQADPTDLVTFPSAYEICFQCVFDSTDVSHTGGEPAKQVSEVACFTSLADPSVKPDLLTCPTGVPGQVAYNCFEPIPKTQSIILEVFWYWRY